MFSKLLQRLFNNKKITPTPAVIEQIKPSGIFSTDFYEFNESGKTAFSKTFQKKPELYRSSEQGATMDAAGTTEFNWQYQNPVGISQAIVNWYGSQSFIGYQLCAMFSQHWLVKKCCSISAKDATRKGYEITVNNGKEFPTEIKDKIRQLDKKYRVTKNMLEFITKGKIFGVRVCIFLVESDDPKYYEKPFNIDSVKPGSYRGMSQVDPYWMTPQPGQENLQNPASQYFYEPDGWQVNGKLYHRTHLCIYREDDDELPDVLKPTYMYGGISVPQKVYERVYAAERTANEAPLLALTKRQRVYKTDLVQAIAQGANFAKKILAWVTFSNNYGVQVIDREDEIQQFDIALADIDNLIMTQYQLVAAIAEVPAVKLLGTSPKGFNATGEFEESSYHETLESLQAHHLTPLLDEHYQRLIKSDIAPQYGINPVEITITWKPLDSMTAKEEAETNNIKADTDVKLAQAGSIDGNDIRDRIIGDTNSGYSGIENGAPEQEEPFSASNNESTLGEEDE